MLFSPAKARPLFLIGIVCFTGCAALFGWKIHAPGILSQEYFSRVSPSQARVALYLAPSSFQYVSRNRGSKTADPQLYFVGESFAPMAVEAFQNAFEEFVLMEAPPTPQIMKRYALPILVAVRIKEFGNKVTWKGQAVSLVTEAAIMDTNLQTLARYEASGSSDAQKVFAKKGGPEVNLNAAIENNVTALVQYVQDGVRTNKW